MPRGGSRARLVLVTIAPPEECLAAGASFHGYKVTEVGPVRSKFAARNLVRSDLDALPA